MQWMTMNEWMQRGPEWGVILKAPPIVKKSNKATLERHTYEWNRKEKDVKRIQIWKIMSADLWCVEVPSDKSHQFSEVAS